MSNTDAYPFSSEIPIELAQLRNMYLIIGLEEDAKWPLMNQCNFFSEAGNHLKSLIHSILQLNIPPIDHLSRPAIIIYTKLKNITCIWSVRCRTSYN